MDLKRAAFGVAAVAAVAWAGAASAATVINDFNLEPANNHFYLTSGSPTSPSISAALSNGFSGAVDFQDTYHFTIPQNGVGSGSLSTSFSNPANLLDITDVIINGVSYASDLETKAGVGETFAVNNLPIVAFQPNTIEVVGFTTGAGGSYGGNATFAATAAIPEPAAWIMMLGGVGLVGAAMRRRREALPTLA